MYLFIVVGTMLVLPLAAWGVEYSIAGAALNLVQALERWFIFWALGVRLFVAGLRQVFQPSFTAQHIFEIDDTKAHVMVQELGFANIAFGLVGILSFFLPTWALPAMLLGMVFYGLAGVNHLFKPKNKTEWIAMLSDLYAAVVFGVLLANALLKSWHG